MMISTAEERKLSRIHSTVVSSKACDARLVPISSRRHRTARVLRVRSWRTELVEELAGAVVEADGESRANPEEAAIVVRLVEDLLAAGVTPEAIGVITPYSAQAQGLRNALPPTIEVDTVDGFQGREKEAVVISLVRSNSQGEIGFLADTRRTNVALTRARRKLIVIGDSATIGAHPFYQRLLEYFERQNAYHTVWELGSS